MNTQFCSTSLLGGTVKLVVRRRPSALTSRADYLASSALISRLRQRGREVHDRLPVQTTVSRTRSGGARGVAASHAHKGELKCL